MRRWVMLEGQMLAQWHLLGEPDDHGRLLTFCGLSLGNDPRKLRSMTDEQVVNNRCAACSEKTLEQLFGPDERPN